MNEISPFAGVRWLFFDVGSTLVDETTAYDRRLREMLQGTTVSFEEAVKKRLEFTQQGLDGNAAVISYFGLTKTPWPAAEERLYPCAEEVLAALKSRGYRLGILANQAPGLAERLARWGISAYFDVIAASAELGAAKPTPLIFQTALAMANCPAGQAVMIGDRLDNDIFPAKSCGMKTVWLRCGAAAYQPEALGVGCADAVAGSLSALQTLFPILNPPGETMV